MGRVAEESRKQSDSYQMHQPQNKNTAPPWQPIFPFMLNTDWYKAYVDDNPGMKIVVLKKDPIGFGLVDKLNETADDQGAKTTDTMDADGEDETAEDVRL